MKNWLGDLGPVTFSQPNPLYRIVVEKTGGERSIRYVCGLELFIKIREVGVKIQ